mmetsp:Transcript_13209/g.21591  ORF Transcript_13209/g.21591 Transcript_13209/m.21591 type:complete len:273 (-) Transcript_13209:738-1556(-)
MVEGAPFLSTGTDDLGLHLAGDFFAPGVVVALVCDRLDKKSPPPAPPPLLLLLPETVVDCCCFGASTAFLPNEAVLPNDFRFFALKAAALRSETYPLLMGADVSAPFPMLPVEPLSEVFAYDFGEPLAFPKDFCCGGGMPNAPPDDAPLPLSTADPLNEDLANDLGDELFALPKDCFGGIPNAPPPAPLMLSVVTLEGIFENDFGGLLTFCSDFGVTETAPPDSLLPAMNTDADFFSSFVGGVSTIADVRSERKPDDPPASAPFCFVVGDFL